MKPLRALVVALALTACAACSKETSKEPPKADEASEPASSTKKKTASASADPDEAPAPSKKKKHAPPKTGDKKAADKDKLAAYWKAMNDGRKATLAKKFDDAIAAFDAALVAVPDDARAYTERGYAKLLAKDYDAAVVDLDKAAARTTDKKLLAQVWFNYGLAAEGKGDAEKARAAFARSNELNPTNAAKKKLEGKSTCPAKIEGKQPSSATTTYASWKAAYESFAEYDDALPKWSGDASLANLCGAGFSKGKPCLAHKDDVAADTLDLLVETKDGKIAVFELAIAGGRCGGDIDGKIVDDGADVVHVHWRTEQGISVLVTEKNGEIVDCTEKDTDCMSACGDIAEDFGDLFVKKETGESLLYVGRAAEGTKDPLTVTADGPTVTIKGKGCDREWPLAK